jgi:glycosyltransferase involved in cell wall biosynthesis
MRSFDVSIVHPLDPANPGLGGFDTCINDFIRYAPDRWQIEVIGVTSDPAARPVGTASQIDVDGRPVTFVPALADREPDVVRPIPLSLRFVLGCRVRRLRPAGRIEQLHRFESAFAYQERGARQALFLHNDPDELIGRGSDIRWRGLAALYWTLFRRAVKQADAMFVVHPASQHSLEARYPDLAGRLRHLPVWADPAVFQPSVDPSGPAADLRAQYGFAAGTQLLVFAGRFASQKNLTLLLEALALCRRHGLDCGLLLVGKGPQEARLRHVVERLDLGPDVRIVPTVDRPTLAGIYRDADLAVCSSHYEAGPRHVLEALACGTPIASTAVGQVVEILSSYPTVGSLADEPTAGSLAQAISKMLGRGKNGEVRQQCLQAAGSYHPEKILREVYQLYTQWLAADEMAPWEGKPDP